MRKFIGGGYANVIPYHLQSLKWFAAEDNGPSLSIFFNLIVVGSLCLQGENGGMTTTSYVTHWVSREENGLRLTCEAFNNGTHFSKIQAAKLTVYYPPQKVFIDSPPEDVPLRMGTRVLLVCHSTGGNPPAKLTWFKNEKEASNAQPQTSSHMIVTRVLNLLLTASDNQAAYRCDATNEAKTTISAQTKLLVHCE
ncbi:hypothetical protein CRENBAI_010284 [Crenichthys baileyi]|uniref:Ig-like domain-containing protein n=1 Tax=Crenichthys baileyi TaxID=28760 RepID=A0AAV9RDF9_9TELE